MTIRSIWAQSSTGAIGAAGTMLWHVPEDFEWFKQQTKGYPVVMGRKTWESFPDRYRPLPDRDNLVVTHQDGYQAPGASVYATLDDAIRHAQTLDDDVWVIGGAEIYRQAMDVVDELWVTDIDTDVEGDAYAPEIGPEWQSFWTDPGPDTWYTSSSGTRYRFVKFRHIPAR
ncbi:MAG: dihydrofolate reductase [Microbacterium sp.]